MEWGKIWITFGTFYDQLRALTLRGNFSVTFDFNVRMERSKKPCPQFLIMFLLIEILDYISFLFPLKLVLKVDNSS